MEHFKRITIHLFIPCSHDLKILDYVKISLGFFIAGLIILMLFIYFESLRFLWPMNWIIAIILVCYRFVSICYHAFKTIIHLQFECFVIAIAPLYVNQYNYQAFFSFAVWCAVLYLFIIIGSLIPVSYIKKIKNFLFQNHSHLVGLNGQYFNNCYKWNCICSGSCLFFNATCCREFSNVLYDIQIINCILYANCKFTLCSKLYY